MAARLPFFILLCVFMACAAPAAAGDMSGAELRNLCVSPSDLDYGTCAGYVGAVAATLLEQNVGPHRACGHERVKTQQLVDTFTSWAELFPDRLGTQARHAAAAALARAFPCRLDQQ